MQEPFPCNQELIEFLAYQLTLIVPQSFFFFKVNWMLIFTTRNAHTNMEKKYTNAKNKQQLETVDFLR